MVAWYLIVTRIGKFPRSGSSFSNVSLSESRNLLSTCAIRYLYKGKESVRFVGVRNPVSEVGGCFGGWLVSAWAQHGRHTYPSNMAN